MGERHHRPAGLDGIFDLVVGRKASHHPERDGLLGEHAGEPLSCYEVRIEPNTGEIRTLARPRLFENSHGLRRPQQRLFALDALGETG